MEGSRTTAILSWRLLATPSSSMPPVLPQPPPPPILPSPPSLHMRTAAFRIVDSTCIVATGNINDPLPFFSAKLQYSSPPPASPARSPSLPAATKDASSLVDRSRMLRPQTRRVPPLSPLLSLSTVLSTFPFRSSSARPLCPGEEEEEDEEDGERSGKWNLLIPRRC